jgi:DNA-directed RNA polymerase specialized sigma subunit
MESVPDKENNFLNRDENEHRFRIVKKALQKLTAKKSNKEYDIFRDMFFHDMSNEELMKKHNASASAVYLAKHRVIKKIKDKIKEESLA